MRRFVPTMAAAALLAAGCANQSGRLLSEAQVKAERGEKGEALSLALAALDADPAYESAVEFIEENKVEVVDSAIRTAEGAASADPEGSQRTYRGLAALSRELRRKGIAVPGGGDFDAGLRAVKDKQGAALKAEADAAYDRGDFKAAAELLISASANVTSDEYGPMIADCQFQLGDKQASSRAYRAAIAEWLKGLRFAKDDSRFAPKIQDAHYQLGTCYAQKNKLRLATEEFEELAKAAPDFRGTDDDTLTARQWADFMRSKATTRLALKKFDDATGGHANVEGRDLPLLIQEKTFAKIFSRKSGYLMPIKSENAAEAIEAIKKSRMGEADPVLRKQLNIQVEDHWIDGKVVSATVALPPPRTSSFNGSVSLPVWGRQIVNGREMDAVIGYQNHSYSYEVTEKSVQVDLTASAQVIKVDGAETKAEPSIPLGEGDQVRYCSAMNFPPPPASSRMTREDAMRKLPDDVQALLSARRELKPTGEIVDGLVELVADRLCTWALEALDVAETRESMMEPCQ